jgi:hypothetical protein
VATVHVIGVRGKQRYDRGDANMRSVYSRELSLCAVERTLKDVVC